MKNIKSIEQFLFESKATAKKRFLDRELISEEIFNTFLEIDTTPTKKFIEKMCEFFVSGSSEGEVIETFQKAISLSERQILSFDISLIKSLSELQTLISEKEDYKSRSERKSNIEVVYEDSRFKVVRPKTKEEAILYGKDTEWCISVSREGSSVKNQFDNYYHRENLTIYIIIDKTKNDRSPYSKIAVLVDEYNKINSTWDSNDKEVNFNLTMSRISFNQTSIFKYDPNKPELVIDLDDIVKGTWVINSDGEVDVEGSVDVSSMNLTKIPVKFGKVTGYFSCYNNHLTSLEGVPSKVGGSFICSNNNLTSLEGAPSYVSGYFNCSFNNLTSLEFAPSKVGGYFDCSYNNLTSLEFAPSEVSGSFDCRDNNLTSLEGAPSYVSGVFSCSKQKNGHKFTKEEVEVVCQVVNGVFV
jgi:hypothetical protein